MQKRRLGRIIIGLMFIHAALVHAGAAHAERRALLIGIDDYTGDAVEEPASEDRWPAGSQYASRRWPPLSGASADAEAMCAMLRKSYRIPKANIVVLRNAQATRARIRQAIESLIAQSQTGDEVLFYYSGHGSQVRSASQSEGDGKDETIVPADSRRGAADIRDKELRRLFNRLLDKKVKLTVILDSCHSGSGVRGDPGWTAPRGVAPVIVPRLEAIDAGPPLVDRGAVVMAAALDSGFAYEVQDDRGHFGAFTRAFLESMRLASPEESVGDLFRRTRARLRLYDQIQQPTLLARPEAKNRRLFGGRQDRQEGTIRVAVEEHRSDGSLVLQAGWVNGLEVGSELTLPGGTAVARITELEGLGRSIAEIVMPARSREPPPRLEPGELLSLSAWAPPPGESIRLWIPEAEGHEQALELAAALAARAEDGAFTWVLDPVTEVPTHVLALRAGQWTLAGPGGWFRTYQAKPSPTVVEACLDTLSRLYVRLPPSAQLRGRLVGTWDHDEIRLTSDPSTAHYVLASAFDGVAPPRYAWLHRSRFGATTGSSDLPPRSEWVTLPDPDTAPDAHLEAADSVALLHQGAKRLARVLGWLTLASQEPQTRFPYRLALIQHAPSSQDSDPGNQPPSEELSELAHERLLISGRLEANREFGIALWAEDKLARPHQERWVYVFTVDSFGKSVLLYPRGGIGDNRFPRVVAGERNPPSQVSLPHADFKVVEPFGRDVYFLFTSSEMIHDVGVFEWGGAGTRGGPTVPREGPPSALERLIAGIGTGRRGVETRPIPEHWSIERLVFTTGH